MALLARNAEKIGALVAKPYLTAWYNTDDPSDGVDIENLALVQAVDSNVCASPTFVECRVRIALLNSTDAAQVLDENCTNPNAGLECRDSSQPSGVKCYDYEIRFTCPPDPGALPEPNLHWELNGRTSASGKAPGWCDGRPKFYNTTIYSNTPGVADGAVNPNEHSTLLLEEGPSSSRHACALRSAVTGQANLGYFSDHCINNLQCCNSGAGVRGITVSVWINDHSESTAKLPFIATGAQQTQTMGFSLDSESYYIKIVCSEELTLPGFILLFSFF
ncbi:cartilage intermediate layer protein 2-like [Lytechinus pictus]|uniref:cartilage intermediate layer protein 2-like n=1 Tax=Lytechinus pictus TaxID=7653 RepID=UPI0030B9DECD